MSRHNENEERQKRPVIPSRPNGGALRQTEHPADPREWGADCDNCPLNGRKPVFGDGPPNTRHAIVQDFPTLQETEQGVPFLGPPGEFLEASLAKHGLTRREVWLDSAIACMPPNGKLRLFLQPLRDAFRKKKAAAMAAAKAARKRANKTGTVAAEREAEKLEAEARDLVFHEPHDCCRPRLFRALKVPRCSRCRKWLRGPNEFLCSCSEPKILKEPMPGEHMPSSTLIMGEYALRSISGHKNFFARVNYVELFEDRRKALMRDLAERARLSGMMTSNTNEQSKRKTTEEKS
jgi:hypothetical protein